MINNNDVLSQELKSTYEVPKDSVEYIESFLEKIKAESAIIRDALLTGSSKSSIKKNISLEPIYEILSVLKETEPLSKEEIRRDLDYFIISSSDKLKKSQDIEKHSYVYGLHKAIEILDRYENKDEVLEKIKKEISLRT